ncbi:MAG: hypothetical protein WCH32_10470 [Pseudomonadota bacterium]
MTLSERISTLTQPLLGNRVPSDGQERLLKLYWNRVGLKKELADLDDEVYQLGDKLKQQAAATQRVRDEFESLETLLGNPELGHAVLAHYQLRGLWRACHLQLAQFVTELRRQQEDRERKQELVQFHEERQVRVVLAARRLVEANQALEAQLQAAAALKGRLAASRGVWHYFRRRALQEEVARQAPQLAGAQQALDDLVRAKRTIEKEPWPEFVGLSLEGQRAINNAVLGYAQLLYVQLADLGLAQRARVARLGTIQNTQYGSRAECDALMAEIAAALAMVKARRDLGEELKARTELLRAAVTYRRSADSIPQDRSLPSAYAYGGRAVPVREANVLAEDYWDLQQLLLG